MEFEQDILNCLEVLRNGGTILYPTDTVWGIGCDATNSKAVEKIYQLKQRPGEKSMIVLASEEREILRHVVQPDLQVFDYLARLEKPTTVVYRGAIGLADNLVARDGSIAIRICRDEFCRHLIKRFRKPIVSTSANLAGEPTPANFPAISEIIRKGVDYVVHFRRNDNTTASPSSLIKWEKGKPIILRS